MSGEGHPVDSREAVDAYQLTAGKERAYSEHAVGPVLRVSVIRGRVWNPLAMKSPARETAFRWLREQSFAPQTSLHENAAIDVKRCQLLS